ncbi:hypothetical protein [Halomarina oriensis]|uniref:Uncharacterized protein n=1 Tax=Halomarina oriensis TaxID=671145 RepID=A0A6B0GEI5_9EURY|nr:hypothetical protein [Halomarina oriensis]MWG32940.1 hypothetical protein [Halomarina oriensis]
MDESRRASDEREGDHELHETLLGVAEGDRLRVTFDESIEYDGTTHTDATFTVTSVHDPESVRNPASDHDVRATVTGYHDAEEVDEAGTVEGWRIRMERHGGEWQSPTIVGYGDGRHPELDHDAPGHETTEGVGIESVDVEDSEE